MEVLHRAGIERNLMTHVIRKLKYLGHFLRGRRLERGWVQVAVRGAIARQQMKFMGSLIEDMGGGFRVAEIPDKKNRWRFIISYITRHAHR